MLISTVCTQFTDVIKRRYSGQTKLLCVGTLATRVCQVIYTGNACMPSYIHWKRMYAKLYTLVTRVCQVIYTGNACMPSYLVGLETYLILTSTLSKRLFL